MRKHKQISIALTSAGSDSGGGAGIQADLKTFAALGVHGTSAITCITAQNPGRVLGVEPCSAEMVRMQMEAVFEELRPRAVKTGMLYTAQIIRSVVDFLRRNRPTHLVMDPVMIATSGARLLQPEAIRILQNELLPLATVVTPNVDEAEVLTGRRLQSVEDLRTAAREIHGRFGCAALVKGGHLKGVKEAVDIFYDGKEELLLSLPFIKGVRTHGTGCTYSSLAITAHLALGEKLPGAVAKAKEYITSAILGSHSAAGCSILNHLHHKP